MGKRPPSAAFSANAGQTILVQFSSILANKTWTAADGVTFADLRGRIQQSWLVVRDVTTCS